MNIKMKKIINSLMLIVLGFFVVCHFVIVDASSNGIGTVKDTYSRTILNGVTYTSESNSFAINGLTINTLATTNNEEISITTSVDTQGIYDKIKDFLFNKLVEILNEDGQNIIGLYERNDSSLIPRSRSHFLQYERQ